MWCSTYSGVETYEDCGHTPAGGLCLKHLELELADRLGLEVLAAAPDQAALGAAVQPADAAITEPVPDHHSGQGGRGLGAEHVILILEVELGLRSLVVVVSGAGWVNFCGMI